MKREDLIRLSEATFFNNDEGLINPTEHREFNEAVIDYIDAGRPATYIVDSDQALNDWANIVAGNDYKHVLIKPGTYTINKTIDLEETGTLTVVGMGGSKIISTASHGLVGYKGNMDYSLIGVNIEVRGGQSAFDSCANLIRCAGLIKDSSSADCACFNDCQYLTNCYANCLNKAANTCCFRNCQYLTNCYGFSAGTGTGGFGRCYYLCQYLTNCAGYSDNTGHVSCFETCECLNGCVGVSNSSVLATNSLAFYSCKKMFGCSGKGIAKSIGFAFSECRCMFGCQRFQENSTTGIYDNCHMTQVGFLSVSDTAEGGYNW